MAVRFQLRKPRYGWRLQYGPPEQPNTNMASNLFLADEVREWLEDNHVVYQVWSQAIKSLIDDKTYLYFYIMIEDDNQAMQFKLTWM